MSRKPGPIRHGTRHAYRVRRCNCAECRAWNAERMRRYYERHPDKKAARHNGWPAYNEKREYGQEPGF